MVATAGGVRQIQRRTRPSLHDTHQSLPALHRLSHHDADGEEWLGALRGSTSPRLRYTASVIFTFGEFTLDSDRYDLRRGDTTIAIEPKIFDVLHFLVEHRDRVVHKEELLEALWPGEFVTDSVLPRCIATARKALGDTASLQTFIQTAHGRGYRFVGSVAEVKTTTSSVELAREVFIGREREFVQLEAATRDALSGAGRLIMIAGEPGIGKTRTADEAIHRAKEAGAQVLEGRCFEGGGAPPFCPRKGPPIPAGA